MRRWLAQRLDIACLVLHLSELLVNSLLIALWRRFAEVSVAAQLLSFVAQMGVGRIVVVSYFYSLASGTIRHAPPRFQLLPYQEAFVVLQDSLCGAWVLYSILHPFAELLTRPFTCRRHSKESPVKYPVLFIHGFACNAGYWYPVLRYLSHADVGELHTISLAPLDLDIPAFAKQVAAKVNGILEETGSEKIILVGHSMGGLVARAYLKWHGGKDCVAKLITLQTPHQGTVVGKSALARCFSGRSIKDMLPGSAFLEELGSPVESNSDGAIPMTSVFSYHDTLISPQESSILEAPNTRNIPFAGLGHLMCPFVPYVQKLILHELINCA